MKQVVGISDMKVSKDPKDTLITYSLGSCIGVLVWDPQAKVAGLLHYMLPDSKIDPERSKARPYMFGDSGIPMLFRAAYGLGAVKERLKVYVVGGSQLMDSAGIFNIGIRNYDIVTRLFAKNGITPTKEDIGGSVNRTISLEIATAKILLKVSGKGEFEL
ncbi:MAG: chemotaxis protein CheD [Proteobacteria bacterium]|nr:chemotaxis protein CheD [Pseudomonadota bacterium]MBU1639432.1 chemotaxis protein CheD [Pseudomonadota bacterium]